MKLSLSIFDDFMKRVDLLLETIDNNFIWLLNVLFLFLFFTILRNSWLLMILFYAHNLSFKMAYLVDELYTSERIVNRWGWLTRGQRLRLWEFDGQVMKLIIEILKKLKICFCFRNCFLEGTVLRFECINMIMQICRDLVWELI